MLSVPDWNIPILGFKSGDPAAEADTQDWTLGIVAEEGSKLGGGEIIDISPSSEYYVTDTFDYFEQGRYMNRVNGGSGDASSEQYVRLDLKEKLSSLTRPGIALSLLLHGVTSPADTAYDESYSWLNVEIRDPSGSQSSLWESLYYRKYRVGSIWHGEIHHGGPFIADVSAYKTQEMEICLTVHRRNTYAAFDIDGWLYQYVMLFEIEG